MANVNVKKPETIKLVMEVPEWNDIEQYKWRMNVLRDGIAQAIGNLGYMLHEDWYTPEERFIASAKVLKYLGEALENAYQE
jgi:hypothetical protein